MDIKDTEVITEPCEQKPQPSTKPKRYRIVPNPHRPPMEEPVVEAEIAAPVVEAKIAAPVVEAVITAHVVEADITASDIEADITASDVEADITVSDVEADTTAPIRIKGTFLATEAEIKEISDRYPNATFVIINTFIRGPHKKIIDRYNEFFEEGKHPGTELVIRLGKLLILGRRWIRRNREPIFNSAQYGRQIAEITFFYRRVRDFPAVREAIEADTNLHELDPEQDPPKTIVEVETALITLKNFFRIPEDYIEVKFSEADDLKFETNNENRYIFGNR